MKAIRVHAPGGPEALRFEDIPDPVPAPGEALVKVDRAGVNFIDVYHRTGLYKLPLPVTLGQEGAGVVTAIGAEVTDVYPGDRVAWAGASGSYAEIVTVPASRLVPIPEGVSARDAAAAMLQGMTAHYLAHSTRPLRAGDSCLVHAAAGGVGLLLCQMAAAAGARVFGTVSTAEKTELARAARAEAIDYTSADFAAEVRRLTGGRGVDVVYDSVGKTTWQQSLESLAPRGMLVLFGQSSGSVPAFDPQLLSQKGSLFLTRPTLGHYTATRAELLARAGEVLGAVRAGRLKLRIEREIPLEDAALAHRLLESRSTKGKLLLVV